MSACSVGSSYLRVTGAPVQHEPLSRYKDVTGIRSLQQKNQGVRSRPDLILGEMLTIQKRMGVSPA